VAYSASLQQEAKMNRIVKLGLLVLALLIMGSTISRPAYAQFPAGGQYIGPEQMQRFVPLLQQMKQKLGEKQFRQLMQSMGPEMSQMMDNQGSFNGGGYGGYIGDPAEQFAPLIAMMKQRLGKKRFAQLMQSLGPMMGNQGSGVGGDIDAGNMAGMTQMPSTGGNRRNSRQKKAPPPEQ
jgi:hypothetical protein